LVPLFVMMKVLGPAVAVAPDSSHAVSVALTVI
jgi:hypothetical protein